MQPRKTILAFACLLIFIAAKADATERWTITSLNWEPYSGSTLHKQGTAINTLREKLKTQGIELEVEYLPWTRAKERAKNPKYVGYAPAWPEEVNAGFLASPAIGHSTINVIAKDATVAFTTLEDAFKNNTVGLVRSYVYPANVTALAEKYAKNVSMTSCEESLTKMLYNDRFNVALTDILVAKYYAQKNKFVEPVSLYELGKKDLVLAIRADAEGEKHLKTLKKLLRD